MPYNFERLTRREQHRRVLESNYWILAIHNPEYSPMPQRANLRPLRLLKPLGTYIELNEGLDKL